MKVVHELDADTAVRVSTQSGLDHLEVYRGGRIGGDEEENKHRKAHLHKESPINQVQTYSICKFNLSARSLLLMHARSAFLL